MSPQTLLRYLAMSKLPKNLTETYNMFKDSPLWYHASPLKPTYQPFDKGQVGWFSSNKSESDWHARNNIQGPDAYRLSMENPFDTRKDLKPELWFTDEGNVDGTNDDKAALDALVYGLQGSDFKHFGKQYDGTLSISEFPNIGYAENAVVRHPNQVLPEELFQYIQRMLKQGAI